MRIPAGILDIHGKQAFGNIVLKGSNGEKLKEYGTEITGSNGSCYVLTAPGDNIIVHYVLNPGVADFVDLQVDGILRESSSNPRPDKEFRNKIKKVSHQERNNKGVLGALKSSSMQVQARDAQHGKFLFM
jgi:hypothetical protein